ncbi:UDP-3-O-(3-hydroxymyristoyl)glucosamine N-acyltransferase [Sinimarinibacterium sp. CAU 1509]|uniref:UDP-3-O-(3-hydroxymyristoyl)glucosamine N-acyltransferase n=1 Tax=Sinimarinibacterium sp. CAU 1509 TaxID=2562283 RepID=UPI0010ACAB35|nr:UDP-3-O-(3-hydroxymyristoyl)glucosamine N-acyltransferase [Sinimarinibacterium sp. CAU 1509]TJY62090.1 UDP-3-O-(3-hydroxymyristoyl)glucosamine N-acyltransferase [Sinimarinibacterium sp. CAU 1509]
MTRFSLRELSERFDLGVHGDAAEQVDGVCTLEPGVPGKLGFLSNPKLRGQLAQTRATAVIVTEKDVVALNGSGLIARDPYLAYARIAALFDPDRHFEAGIHPSATVDPTARVAEGCWVGPNAVIEAGAQIGAGSFIGPGCVIARDVRIGESCRLVAQVYLGPRVSLGARCELHPGSVVGGRGFGNARGPEGWEAVPQLGSVRVGNDVEIGANTCIDRGALDDTVIEDGVRLDNLIQIAHNCHIGAHTAIAACTGIAGSARVGRRCMIAGGVGIAGHIEIADDVVILGFAMVTGSVAQKGVYGSGLPLDEAREWRKTVARLRRLERTEQRLRVLERRVEGGPEGATGTGSQSGEPINDV